MRADCAVVTDEQAVDVRDSDGSGRRPDRRRRNLRRQWLLALVVMLLLLVSAGVSALAATAFVSERFASSAAQLEAEGRYAARLQADLTAEANVAHEFIAGVAAPSRVLAAQSTSEAQFAAGAALFRDRDMRQALDRAHETWRATYVGVRLWGPQVQPFTFRSTDIPRHLALSAGMARTTASIVAVDDLARMRLRADLAAAGRLRELGYGAVAGVLLIALLAMLYFARRMSLDVLRPVEALQDGVGRLRAGDLQHRVELRSTRHENELTDLTAGFNDMADELASTHRDLTYRAMHDSLTGLPNRLALRERLSVEFSRFGGRREGPDLSILFVDLDDFKVVNDELGHAAGDELLVQVAARLTACAPSADTVGRLGGDEFAIVVQETGANMAMAVAERVLGALSSPFVVAGKTLTVTASIGIGSTGPATTSAEELLGHADYAMYMAKGHGKRRFETYDPALHAVSTERAALRSDLRNAIDNGELRLDYQPVIDLSSGRIVGTEALVRWHHPVRGLIPPLEFIPVAEQTHMIDEIGLWVLRTATNQLARWRSTSPIHADLWMAVNVSPVQLRNQAAVASLVDQLATGAVPANAIVLEITESDVVLGVEGAVAAMRMLRDTGARIALDDFGTGLSSLSTLIALPIDVLKIDRAFVSGQQGGIPSTPVLRTVVALAAELGLDVIAEGIEEPDQSTAVHALGCALGQGFAIARPAAPDVVDALLQRQPKTRMQLPVPRIPAHSDSQTADAASEASPGLGR